MKNLLSIIILIITFGSTYAQEESCKAQESFNGIQCVIKEGNPKCVSISVNHDPLGKKFDYEWELSDGKILKGQNVAHCFADFAVYEIRLHLVDPVSGFKFKDELTKTINLSKDKSPEITNVELIQNSPAHFSYAFDVTDFESSEVYWDFGDGNYSCEVNPEHTYIAGEEVEVRILIKGEKFGELIEYCASKAFTVKPYILDGDKLNELFSVKEQELTNRGRFLQDEVHYIIYEKNDPTKYQQFDIENDKYNISIDPNKEYEMYAWKGNLFTPIQAISTMSLTKEQTEVQLRKSISTLFDTEPQYIDGFKFGLDGSAPSSKDIDNVADMMKTYQHINIAVGVYTHTGGRMDRNLALSKTRGEHIKEELEARGIQSTRLIVVTAKEAHNLLNTCYGVINCDLEDESLNRKAEFKVTGISNNQF